MTKELTTTVEEILRDIMWDLPHEVGCISNNDDRTLDDCECDTKKIMHKIGDYIKEEKIELLKSIPVGLFDSTPYVEAMIKELSPKAK